MCHVRASRSSRINSRIWLPLDARTTPRSAITPERPTPVATRIMSEQGVDDGRERANLVASLSAAFAGADRAVVHLSANGHSGGEREVGAATRLSRKLSARRDEAKGRTVHACRADEELTE